MSLEGDVRRMGRTRPFDLLPREARQLIAFSCVRKALKAGETLLRDVWGYNANVTTHTLETHIYRLRQKIEDDPADARLLVTDAGGYKLLS